MNSYICGSCESNAVDSAGDLCGECYHKIDRLLSDRMTFEEWWTRANGHGAFPDLLKQSARGGWDAALETFKTYHPDPISEDEAESEEYGVLDTTPISVYILNLEKTLKHIEAKFETLNKEGALDIFGFALIAEMWENFNKVKYRGKA